ncbi:hypothetical protein RQP46_010792 [Phenoliferia psychrophenolica]
MNLAMAELKIVTAYVFRRYTVTFASSPHESSTDADNVATSSRIQISRLSHITYYHTDLDKLRVFNRDFGFGYGPDAYCEVTVKSDKIAFGGVSWLAASREDLINATKIPEAGAIEKLTGPGGGERVAFTDYFGKPGFVVFGIEGKTATAQSKLTLNYPEEKVRRNDFQRFEQGPAKINKLGHWGYITGDFAGGSASYRETFNLRYSDIQEHQLPDGKVEEHSGFFRLDRGAEFVDHLFDYWFDPTGFRVEHYADGDWLAPFEAIELACGKDGPDVLCDPWLSEQLRLWAATPWGRVIACGAIAPYHDVSQSDRITVQGFLVFDFPAQVPEAKQVLAAALKAGHLKL